MRGKAVGCAENSVRHPDFLGLGVHLFDEDRDGTGGDAGKSVRGVVGRLDHHGVDEFFDRESLTRVEVHLGATHVCVGGIDADGGFERKRATLEAIGEHRERHELGHAGGRREFVGVVLEQDIAAGGVEDDVTFVAADGRFIGGPCGLLTGSVGGKRERGCDGKAKENTEAIHLCVLEDQGIFRRGRERKTAGGQWKENLLRITKEPKPGKTFRTFALRCFNDRFSTNSAGLAGLLKRQVVKFQLRIFFKEIPHRPFVRKKGDGLIELVGAEADAAGHNESGEVF